MEPELDIYVESLRNFRAASDYLITHVAGRLLDAGIRVRFLDRMPRGRPAPAAFVHVDLTVVPEAYRAIPRSYQRTVNGEALSIHRDLYSTLRLKPGDAHNGAVIVKTVLNSRGRPELRWQRYQSPQSWAAYRLHKIGMPGFNRWAAPSYRLYRSLAEVPDAVWRDERLMVEKFALDTLELPIVKHRCIFFRDVDVNLKETFTDVLCARGTMVNVEDAGPIPHSVTEVRQRLRIEYGAIDYFVAAGGAVVVDVNKTPGTNLAVAARYRFRKAFNDRLVARLTEFVRDEAAGTAQRSP